MVSYPRRPARQVTNHPPLTASDTLTQVVKNGGTVLNPAEYFDHCQFCEQPPAHVRANNGSNPVGGFDENGVPRNESQLRTWLSSLLVTETPWPDNIEATCDQHLFYRWNPDGTPELSPSGQAMLQAKTNLKDAQRIHRGSIRQQVIEAYGGKCVECGKTADLQIWHPPGAEAPLHPSGAKLRGESKYRYLIKAQFPTGWVLRCGSCSVW